VRDCLHPRDLVPLLDQQMITADGVTPPVVNVSGGVASACSLRQVSEWCAERFGPHPISVVQESRPFDIPWLVLDNRDASRLWRWSPTISREAIFNEIAAHSECHPDWFEVSHD
jgi:CDP-paratose 2-epimerase